MRKAWCAMEDVLVYKLFAVTNIIISKTVGPYDMQKLHSLFYRSINFDFMSSVLFYGLHWRPRCCHLAVWAFPAASAFTLALAFAGTHQHGYFHSASIFQFV
jgi:hypothetical protein